MRPKRCWRLIQGVRRAIVAHDLYPEADAEAHTAVCLGPGPVRPRVGRRGSGTRSRWRTARATPPLTSWGLVARRDVGCEPVGVRYPAFLRRGAVRVAWGSTNGQRSSWVPCFRTARPKRKHMPLPRTSERWVQSGCRRAAGTTEAGLTTLTHDELRLVWKWN